MRRPASYAPAVNGRLTRQDRNSNSTVIHSNTNRRKTTNRQQNTHYNPTAITSILYYHSNSITTSIRARIYFLPILFLIPYPPPSCRTPFEPTPLASTRFELRCLLPPPAPRNRIDPRHLIARLSMRLRFNPRFVSARASSPAMAPTRLGQFRYAPLRRAPRATLTPIAT